MNALIYSNRPLRHCPHCSVAACGRFLPHVSDAAIVDYYRCDECGHVWTSGKQPFTPPIMTRPKPDRRRLPR